MKHKERVTDPEWARGTWEWHECRIGSSDGEWSPVKIPWGISEVMSLVLVALITVSSITFRAVASPAWLGYLVHFQGITLMIFLILGCMGKRTYRDAYGEIPSDRFQALLLLLIIGGGAGWAFISLGLYRLVGIPIPV